MSMRLTLTALLVFFTTGAHAQEKPNIVLVFMDNFGWGELGCYGGILPDIKETK